MSDRLHEEQPAMRKAWIYRKGKLYFDKKTERLFFFVMTLLMLLLGILAKMDFF